jgi:hypothetical protein
MAKVKKFEEIQSWKKARVIAKEIYYVTRTGPFAKDFGLKDQMRRAAVSIMSNIAEGFERGGIGNFCSFLRSQRVPPANFALNSILLLTKNIFRGKSLNP